MLTETGNSSKHEILIRRRSKKLSKIFRPSTSYPRPSTIYPRPSTIYPRPSTSYPRPSTLDEKANSGHSSEAISKCRNKLNLACNVMPQQHGQFLLRCTKCNIQMGVGGWPADHAKKAELTDNLIAFEILSALRLSLWVDAMVNLYGLYMAVVFLWRFRLRLTPLSLDTLHLVSASCVTRKKCFTRAFFFSRGQVLILTVTINGLSERGNTPNLIAI